MAEIVATESIARTDADQLDLMAQDCFLFDEGLELLADFRGIADPDVRTSLRALVKSMARQSRRLSS